MNTEEDLIEYVLRYFSDLLTEKESKALKHANSMYKIENGSFETQEKKEKMMEMYYSRSWLTHDKASLDLLKDGVEQFRQKVVKRILKEEQIELNRCSKCKGLARTPKAKQCRFCGNDWR